MTTQTAHTAARRNQDGIQHGCRHAGCYAADATLMHGSPEASGLRGMWLHSRGVGEQLAKAVEQARQLQPLCVRVRQAARLWDGKGWSSFKASSCVH